MARTHLTLAAVATAAVPGLEVNRAGAVEWGASDDFASALLHTDAGERVVRVPRHPHAESEQSLELLALAALSQGVRSRLPFDVPRVLGQAPVDGTRAVVYECAAGTAKPLTAFHVPDAEAAARAIAAVHALPTSFVAEAGLPVQEPIECLRSAVSVVDRAAATGLVPAMLLDRWGKATEDQSLWQFQPTVVHGALSSRALRFSGDTVSSIISWHALRVADPALDLAWLLAARGTGVAEAAVDAYTAATAGADRQVRHRAALYAELDVARWLLHGTDSRSTEVVDDAVQMLSTLVDHVQADVMNPIGPSTQPIPTVSEVEALLDQAERARNAG
ncbi:phosphotransferase [Ruicaihuangia caeni]|uniref:Phosphotransferase n=1 Tax=Ruicaihuangia caeni TaxID=3042517 RepID=A0AAW6TF25_9MICO|nr:phosphotransferase [Klugiella sp. YN-L-19]MDI2099677.1 phosphotransferase [Klugiella sp. YN-L-19]